MALADTARLLSSLELQDKFSGPAKTITGSLGGLEQKSSFVQKGFGLMSTAAGGVGGAFSTLKGRIGQLISGPLGMLGLGAGLFSVFGLLKGGIDQAQDFAKEVGRLSAVTGLNTDATSRLAGAFHHFGIETDTALTIAGVAEKNLFKLGGTTKAADKFLEKYGFSLVDSTGKLKDFNSLLLDTSDFFNNAQIPSATKAAALAAIYGKNWQALIPILGAGREAISDAEEEAQALGLTLTKDNLDSLKKLKTATREWGTTLGGLKLQLGLAVVPLLTDLTRGASNFLSTADEFGRTGSQKIVSFLKDMIEFGKKAFGVITDQVVPLVKKVIDGWNNLPEPLKGLLIKGAAGNFAVKFLLGWDPIAIAGAAATAIAGKIAGAAAGAVTTAFGGFIGDFFGKTAANKLVPQLVEAVAPIPVFVTNPGFGLPGKGPDVVDTATKVGFWATVLKFVKFGALRVVPALAVGEVAGQSNVNTTTQALMVSTIAHQAGTTLKDVLATSEVTVGGIKEFAANEELRAGVDQKLLTAIDAWLVSIQPPPVLGPFPRQQIPLGPGRDAVDPAIDRLIREQQTLSDTALAPLGSIEKDVAHLPSIEESQRQILERLGRSSDTSAQTLDTLRGQAGSLIRLEEKKWDPKVSVNVAATANISVSNVARTLTSFRIAGSTTVGGFTESAF